MKWFKTSNVKTWIVKTWLVACVAAISLMAGAAMAQDKELRVGYQPNPIQDASIAMMERWGAKNGVKIIKICPEKSGIPGLRFFHPKWTGLLQAMQRANADVYYQNGGECVTGQAAQWCRKNHKPFVF